jgi:hypothetical protein
VKQDSPKVGPSYIETFTQAAENAGFVNCVGDSENRSTLVEEFHLFAVVPAKTELGAEQSKTQS